ncbi:hypothetical protein Vafri_1988, partial [Volvox africanus]
SGGAHRRHYFFGPAAAAMAAATAVAGLLSLSRRQSRRASTVSIPAGVMPSDMASEAAQDFSDRSHCSQANHVMALAGDASGGGARPRSREWHNRAGIGQSLLHLVGLNASRRHSTLGPAAATAAA